MSAKTVHLEGKFRFEFAGAREAFVFDDKDEKSVHFHGAPMKAVDVFAEFEKSYLFVEVKELNPASHDAASVQNPVDQAWRKKKLRELREELKYKFRDSLLYRFAESKVDRDKTIHYVCLLVNFHDPLIIGLTRDLTRELPVGKVAESWERPIVDLFHVVNLDGWRNAFCKNQWHVTRLPQEN